MERATVHTNRDTVRERWATFVFQRPFITCAGRGAAQSSIWTAGPDTFVLYTTHCVGHRTWKPAGEGAGLGDGQGYDGGWGFGQECIVRGVLVCGWEWGVAVKTGGRGGGGRSVFRYRLPPFLLSLYPPLLCPSPFPHCLSPYLCNPPPPPTAPNLCIAST